MNYAVESETASGWCPPQAQLALSGLHVARAHYDTPVEATAPGESAPKLGRAAETQHNPP